MKSLLMRAAIILAAQWGWSQTMDQTQELDSVFIESKIAMDRQDSGRVTTLIGQDQLANLAGNSLPQVLNRVAGIEINGARSNAGQNLGYYVRGGRNRQVVIMVDGVQLNDPSSISNDFDLRLIPLSSVQQIEIIKGASSVLYGSGAATAVISITTKKVGDDLISGQFGSTLASNRSSESGGYGPAEIINTARIGGSSNRFSYDIRLDHRFADGISAVAAPEAEPAFDPDIFNRFNTRLELGYQFKNGPAISRFVSKDRFKADFDDFSYRDADNRSISDHLRTGGKLDWSFGKGKWVINDSHSWLERETESGFPTRFESTSSTFDTYFTYPVFQSLTLVVGVNANWSRFSGYSVPFGGVDLEETISDETARFNIVDPYLNLTYISNFGLNINAGLRMNNHSDYGQNWVYQINPSYRFDLGRGKLRVLASYSTAYITPSLFQLYDPLYGNTELEPEQNRTIEAGLAYQLKGNWRLSAVYFDRRDEQFVDFVTVDPDLFIFQYQNIADSFSSSGVEVEASKQFGPKWLLTANYTYTDAEDRFALRIPEHKVNAALSWLPMDKLQLNLSYQYVGQREDSYFNSDSFATEQITLSAFNLLDLGVNYQVCKQLRLYAAVTNLTNTEYQEIYRFQTAGRNIRFGFGLDL